MQLPELLRQLDPDFPNYTTFSACLKDNAIHFNSGELSALSHALQKAMPHNIDNVYTNVQDFKSDMAVTLSGSLKWNYYYIRHHIVQLAVYTIIKHHPEVNNYGELQHIRAQFNKRSKKAQNKLKVHASTFMDMAKYMLVRARVHKDQDAQGIVNKLFWFTKQETLRGYKYV